MAITITINDGINTPTVFTLSDAISASLEQFRATLTGDLASTDIIDMIAKLLTKVAITPALSNFPPDTLASQIQDVATAQIAFKTALSQAIATALTPQ